MRCCACLWDVFFFFFCLQVRKVIECFKGRAAQRGDAILLNFGSSPDPFFFFGNGPNTVSGSTVSNTELSEIFGAHWVPGSGLSESLSACYLCAKASSPSFSRNSLSLPPNSVRLSEISPPKQNSKQYSAHFPMSPSALKLAPLGCTPRGSCNRTLLRRVLRRFSNSKCFLEGFLEGAFKGFQSRQGS